MKSLVSLHPSTGGDDYIGCFPSGTVIPQLIESRPEFVLMDWHMPGYTGSDLASIIRQQDAFISIPIVFLTTENDPEKRMQAMRIGADDFLVKPVSSRAWRYKAILSFAMVDMDYFKRINDTYNYLNGDKVLKDLANLFRERLRKNDLIFECINSDAVHSFASIPSFKKTLLIILIFSVILQSQMLF